MPYLVFLKEAAHLFSLHFAQAFLNYSACPQNHRAVLTTWPGVALIAMEGQYRVKNCPRLLAKQKT